MMAKGRTSKPILFHISAWIAQVFIATIFGFSAWMKMTTPIAELQKMMLWTADAPEGFVRLNGAIDAAGAIGIVVPAAIGVWQRLTIPAAIGCALVQICAITLHAWRGEFAVLPLNLILMPMCLYVLWVRTRRAPLGPHGLAAPKA